MYNMAKSLKTDMSELKTFPNRNFITMEDQKTKKKSQKFTGKCYFIM